MKKKKYLYENHLGGYFSSEKKYSHKQLYCEECGDCDYLIGEFTDEKSLRELLNDIVDPEYAADGYIDRLVEDEFPKERK